MCIIGSMWFFIYVNMNKTDLPINHKMNFLLQLNADNGYSYLPFPFFARLDLGS